MRLNTFLQKAILVTAMMAVSMCISLLILMEAGV